MRVSTTIKFYLGEVWVGVSTAKKTVHRVDWCVSLRTFSTMEYWWAELGPLRSRAGGRKHRQLLGRSSGMEPTTLHQNPNQRKHNQKYEGRSAKATADKIRRWLPLEVRREGARAHPRGIGAMWSSSSSYGVVPQTGRRAGDRCIFLLLSREKYTTIFPKLKAIHRCATPATQPWPVILSRRTTMRFQSDRMLTFPNFILPNNPPKDFSIFYNWHYQRSPTRGMMPDSAASSLFAAQPCRAVEQSGRGGRQNLSIAESNFMRKCRVCQFRQVQSTVNDAACPCPSLSLSLVHSCLLAWLTASS